MATEQEYALMSLRVYSRTAENRGPVPEGWAEIMYREDDPSTGFSAGCYRNWSTGEIVVAFTGTNGDMITDFTQANAPAAFGIFSPHVEDALQFVSDVKEMVGDSFPISFTGHSLGGGLASMMSIYFNEPATIFDTAPGQDTVAGSITTDNTVSIGNAVYADLLFQKNGNDLILSVGATDRITFTDYYASAANRSVNALQVVLEGTAGYDAGAGDVLRDNKIEVFNFEGLVAAFDAARDVNPTLTSWALTNALLSQHLSGSDTDAIGGDLAYRYNRYGTLSDISFTPALGALGAGTFGTGAQALGALAGLQDSSPRLS